MKGTNYSTLNNLLFYRPSKWPARALSARRFFFFFQNVNILYEIDQCGRWHVAHNRQAYHTPRTAALTAHSTAQVSGPQRIYTRTRVVRGGLVVPTYLLLHWLVAQQGLLHRPQRDKRTVIWRVAGLFVA